MKSLPRILLLVLLPLTLSACNHSQPTAESPTPPPTLTEKSDTEKPSDTSSFSIDVSSDQVSTQPTTISQSGEPCGATTGRDCAPELQCQLNVADPTQPGTCQPVYERSLGCDKTKQPVCGLKGRIKLIYLNECFAQQADAEIVNQGFCTDTPAQYTQQCDAAVTGVENCPTLHTGFEFSAGKCREVSVQGCRVESPFTSLAECESQCS